CSRLIPFGAPISSRTGCSRLRRGPLTCEAHDGAVLRCGNPVLVPLDSLPLRHHVDRSPLLLQLRAGSVHGRGGRGDQERRDAEARAAGTVVVPVERGRHGPGRRRHAGAAACELEGSLGLQDSDGRGVGHRDARQRSAGYIARAEGRDRRVAPDQRVGGNDGADEETERDGARGDRDRSGDGAARLLDRPGRAELAGGLTLAATTSTTLPVGAVAPDFALPSTAGTDVTLSAFRG